MLRAPGAYWLHWVCGKSDQLQSDGAFDVGSVGADPRATCISFSEDGYQPLEEVGGEKERRTMAVTLQPLK